VVVEVKMKVKNESHVNVFGNIIIIKGNIIKTISKLYFKIEFFKENTLMYY